MEVNPLIFRAYDIRGIAEKDLTEESMRLIGRAYGTYMGRKYGKNLACGRDNRTHGELLQGAFINGMLESGCAVTNVGLATSPMLYYATCRYDFDGGVNITASHNPKEYNGAKLVAKNAHSVCGPEIQEILKLIEMEDFAEGRGSLLEQKIFEDYIADVAERITIGATGGSVAKGDGRAGAAGAPKIVIDAGNGVTGCFAPQLFRKLGCEVIEQHCELDGTFPNHEANPEEEKNIADLRERVLAEKADLGVAFDGDGDRVGIIDEKGYHYHADYLLIPLARDLLSRHPGHPIVFDIKTSKVVEDDIAKHGGKPIRYKTGHSFIEAKMKEIGSLLAGETSGHMFFGENYFGFDDALFAAAKLIEIMTKSGGPFSALLAGLPIVFNTPEFKAPCADGSKFNVVADVKEYFLKRYPCITIDGVWVDFGEGTWGAVRASNTSPNLTLRFESRTEQGLKMAKRMIVDKLKEYPEVDVRGIE